MMQNKIKRQAIFFDIGNVLVKLGPPIESWLDPKDPSRLKALLNDYGIGDLGTSSFFQGIKAISRHPCGAIPIERWFVEKRLLGPFPGAVALLSILAKKDIDVFLFSNTNEVHWSHINGYSFEYKRAFVSFLMKSLKPNLDAFKSVENSTESAGEEIIFFDDSLINIEMANSLGWNGHLATGLNPIDGVIEILKGKYQIDI